MAKGLTAAPLFTLPSNTGEAVSLADMLGRKVVLYFYPKDNTPGCTLETHDFSNHYARFTALNTEVFGISRDSVNSHKSFAKKCALPFQLLADVDGTVCEKYGVLKQKNMFGRKYIGIERTTFLVDEEGLIHRVWNDVSVLGHAKAVLACVEGQ